MICFVNFYLVFLVANLVWLDCLLVVDKWVEDGKFLVKLSLEV